MSSNTVQSFRKHGLLAKTLLLLTLVLSSAFLFSMDEEPTVVPDKNTALTVARNFYIIWSSHNIEAKYKAPSELHFKLVYEEFATPTESGLNKSAGPATPLFYVFNVNSDDGFVIVSGCENVKPVLAYAFRGAFNKEKQSPAFRLWMENYKTQILHVLDHHIEAEENITNEWKQYKSSSQHQHPSALKQVSALLSTRWDQKYPYSSACPVDTGRFDGRSPAGCAAVAMAQITKFWEHPKSCNFIEGYWSSAYDSICCVKPTGYFWSMMPAELCDSSDANEIEEVSRLIYHCGVSIQTSYGPLITASGITMIPQAFQKSFSYNTTARLIRRKNFTTQTWKGLLKSELDLGRPVLYLGKDPKGSHAFVCDGYQNSGHFHINWGWGGVHDGYYLLDNLAPGEWKFYKNHRAVVGIEPDSTTSAHSNGSTGVIEDFRIFPNPVSELLTVQLKTGGSFQLEITSLNGQRILGEKMEGNIHRLNLSSLPSGIYFLSIRNKNRVTTKKIIKL